MTILTLLSLSWQHLLILLLILLPLYFLPTFVAYAKKHSNAEAIFTINLLLGWSLIGWLAALVWALLNKQSNISNIDQLAKLKELYDKGVITDEEFLTQKKKLLS
ncbi:superinfection immunity protein [Chryseobacterium hispalense]|uniref:superinfection immunity protein n=1 Tax=Chryseobacterium hispalense TaxID=1453492 RepID=UPI0009E8DA28|nr:superinfection immunity protein [Chryseobacterium hispalense]